MILGVPSLTTTKTLTTGTTNAATSMVKGQITQVQIRGQGEKDKVLVEDNENTQRPRGENIQMREVEIEEREIKETINSKPLETPNLKGVLSTQKDVSSQVHSSPSSQNTLNSPYQSHFEAPHECDPVVIHIFKGPISPSSPQQMDGQQHFSAPLPASMGTAHNGSVNKIPNVLNPLVLPPSTFNAPHAVTKAPNASHAFQPTTDLEDKVQSDGDGIDRQLGPQRPNRVHKRPSWFADYNVKY
ncbi:hypothetical protein RIF29_26700 [Crotalaria pallida]|uniref:Uncharacterized protein n=1 Tax=Crotalaria pallida TaxID=3830 RepID=A0AAN9EVA1_CROPI